MPVNKDFYTLAGSSGQSTGYTIDQSLRFDSSTNVNLIDSSVGAGDTRKKNTFSVWVKRANLGSLMYIMAYRYDATNYQYMSFDTSNRLEFTDVSGGSVIGKLITNRVFRDLSAWYNLTFVWDTANVVSTERMILYVNGVRETSFNTETYPSQNVDSGGAGRASSDIRIGTYYAIAGTFFDGYMANIVYIDNGALDASSFGETNENGIWVPIDVSGLTFGTRGFYIDGRDASDLGDDESGNGNDFSSGLSAHDQVLDSPTNNWCVMNPLANPGGATFKEGNLKVTMASGTKKGTYSSFAINSGKWYVEGRLTSNNNGSQYAYTGIEDYNAAINSGQYIGRDTYGYSYDPANGGVLNNNSYVVSSGTLPSVAQGDIIQIAVDLDNNAIYWGKNGTYLNSGNPASGASKTGGVSVTAASSQPSSHYHIGHSNGTGSSGYQSEIVWNFGQDGTFTGGTTAGGNSDGNGIGNFKYSVPSGYLALCTSNLGS